MIEIRCHICDRYLYSLEEYEFEDLEDPQYCEDCNEKEDEEGMGIFRLLKTS